MFNNKINYKLINLTAFMLLLYIAVTNVGLWWNILGTIIKIIFPFIVAFAFAYALHPLVIKLEKKGIRRSLAVTIITLAVVLIIVSLITITLPMIYDQLKLFSKMIVEVMQDVGNKFDVNLGTYEISIKEYLNNAISNLGSVVSSGTIDFISRSLGFVGEFIVGFIATIYFLADMKKIRHSFKEFLKDTSARAFKYFKILDNEIGHYVHGLAIFMVIQFVEYSFIFWIVGHPNWLLLGALACVTTVIPYFGGLFTNLVAVITASVVSTPVFIGTIIICLIFPQLDGYVTSPRIYGKTNNVNPLITIMVVSIGGTLAGITGIIAALPVYLFIRTTYHFFKKDLKKGMVIVKKNI